jgi:hypothetical protein
LPWFKLWPEALSHEKVVGLSDGAFRTWITVLAEGSRQAVRWRFASVKHAVSVTGRPVKHIRELIAARLLDEAATGELWVHDWRQWQDRYVSDFAPKAPRERSVKAPSLLRDDSANAPNKLRERSVKTPTEEEEEGEGEEEKETDTSGVPRIVESGGSGGAAAAAPPERTGKTPRGSFAPDEFPLSEQHRQQAERYGVRPDRIAAETAKFLDHHRSRGTRFIDWQAAWRTWMQRVSDYGQPPRTGLQAPPPPAPPFAPSRLPAKNVRTY